MKENMKDTIANLYKSSFDLNGEERVQYLEDILEICKGRENYSYEYLVRLELIKELKKIYKLNSIVSLLNENLELAIKKRYDGQYFIENYTWFSRHIDAVSNVTEKDIDIFFERMEKVFRINECSLRNYYQGYYNYLMRIGRWEEGLNCYSRWVIEKRDNSSESIGVEEADRSCYYFTIGDYENGKYVFETVKKGLSSIPGTKAYAYPRVIKYYIELGDWSMVSYLINRGYNFNKYNFENVEEIAEVLKPLALVNPKVAIKYWKRHRRLFEKTDNERAKFSFGISAYLIRKEFENKIENKRIESKIDRDIKTMYGIQEKMDERNRSNAFHEEVMYWLEFKRKFDKKNK